MNLLDMIIIAGMIFVILRGIFRGFFRETGSLAGVVIGIWLANAYQPRMSDYLSSYLPPSKFLPLISFAGICLLLSKIFHVFSSPVPPNKETGFLSRKPAPGASSGRGDPCHGHPRDSRPEERLWLNRVPSKQRNPVSIMDCK